MATVRSEDAICKIVKHRILELETEAGRKPVYYGIVRMEGMLLVVDLNECDLQVYNGHDGKLITSHRLESYPRDVCVISQNEVAVCLDNGTFVILSLKSIDDVKLVKTLKTGFYHCYSLAKWNSDKLIVSGCKNIDMLCWGILSIRDGRMDSTHNICEGIRTRIAIKDNTVYISCRTYDSITTGVHVYDMLNPETKKFLYQHQELKTPRSIMADRDYVYVCDYNSNRIHQLTDSGQLVTIHRVSSEPYGIFYDDQQGLLYTTSYESNVITVYKMEYLHQPGVPIEILKMDDRSIQLFEEALKDGMETVHSIRIMVVGHMGVGKTTLVKRLLGEEVNISDRLSTEGIDVYVNCCDVSLLTHEWTRRTKDLGQDYRLQRIAKVLNEQYSVAGKVSDELVLNPLEEDRTESLEDSHAAVKDQNAEVLHHHSSEKDIDHDVSSATNQQEESTAHEQEESTIHKREESTAHEQEESNAHEQQEESTADEQEESTAHEQEESTAHEQEGSTAHEQEESTAQQQEESSSAVVQKMTTLSKTNTIAMIQLLKDNVNTIEGTGEKSLLTIWDFAGQYAFYTTHQTFLTRRAIYLLVSDVSGQVTDLVADDCYFDSKGIMNCEVHELVEVWLNSIHSCASSPEAYSPPVILVGTHVDKISQKLSPAKGEASETQNETSEALEFNLSTTSTPGAISANEPPRASTIFGAVKKFFQPRKTGDILEVTPVPSLAGDHAVLADDHLKKHKKWSWLPGRKKNKAKITLMSAPLTEEPVRETVMGVDAENVRYKSQDNFSFPWVGSSYWGFSGLICHVYLSRSVKQH